MLARSFFDNTFRANPGYELVALDRLEIGERRRLLVAAAELGNYGVLRPRHGSTLRSQSISADAALLFFSLREPGPVPAYIRSSVGLACLDMFGTLVRDGILEVAVAGAFISGRQGAEALLGTADEAADTHGFDGLALAALRFADASDSVDIGTLAAHLYRYNRIPASPNWRRRLASPVEFRAFTGIALVSAIPLRLRGGWYSWTATDTRDPAEFTYKLYVAPQPAAVRETVAAISAQIPRSKARALKVGADLDGLLRPDKIILYFQTFDALADMAHVLQTRLAGMPAHGVPFTARVGCDALLSWGIDPPLRWWASNDAPLSWRRWVTLRVAAALVSAKQKPGTRNDRWLSLERRIGLDGLDPRSWTPPAALRRLAEAHSG